MYKHATSEDDHVSLQMGLDVLQEWSDRWLLKLYISKCKTVLLGAILITIIITIFIQTN